MILLKDILKEIINEKTSTRNNNLDEKISDYFPGRFNSAAAEAKRQGLRSIGFGRWVNKDNKVVAKSVDGKLQAVKPNERTPPKDRDPKTKPLDPSRDPDAPQALDTRQRDLKRRLMRKVAATPEERLETPEAQEALRTGRHFTGEELERMLGITPQQYRRLSWRDTSAPYPMRDLAIGPQNVAGPGAADKPGWTRLEYYPKTKTYRLRHFFRRNNPSKGGDYDGNDPYYAHPSPENKRKFIARYKDHPLQMHGPIDDPLY